MTTVRESSWEDCIIEEECFSTDEINEIINCIDNSETVHESSWEDSVTEECLSSDEIDVMLSAIVNSVEYFKTDHKKSWEDNIIEEERFLDNEVAAMLGATTNSDSLMNVPSDDVIPSTIIAAYNEAFDVNKVYDADHIVEPMTMHSSEITLTPVTSYISETTSPSTASNNFYTETSLTKNELKTGLQRVVNSISSVTSIILEGMKPVNISTTEIVIVANHCVLDFLVILIALVYIIGGGLYTAICAIIAAYLTQSCIERNLQTVTSLKTAMNSYSLSVYTSCNSGYMRFNSSFRNLYTPVDGGGSIQQVYMPMDGEGSVQLPRYSSCYFVSLRNGYMDM
jgi:hypothetical protein